ncbi:MAG: SWIM zinc finger family protein [Spirochaetales bacterium]|nr:SWIM zinc finger family protein [Spirochaetales bacterium]
MAHAITEELVRKNFHKEYYERGLEYYRSGRIVEPVKKGDTLYASCTGSEPEPYRLSVKVSDSDFTQGRCSCQTGGGCEHVVALLLFWAREPGLFLDGDAFAASLAARSKEELAAFIGRALDRHPELAYVIARAEAAGKNRKAEIDPRPVRDQIVGALLPRRGRYAPAEDDAVHSTLRKAEKFLKHGDPANAFMLFDAVASEILEHYMEVEIESELAYDVDLAVDGMARCLKSPATDGKTRLEIVKALFGVMSRDAALGGYGLGGSVPGILAASTTPDERAAAAEWARESSRKAATEWDKRRWAELLCGLYAADGDLDRCAELAENFGLHETLFEKLLERKETDRALAVARGRPDDDRLDFCERLDGAGLKAEAIALAEEIPPDDRDDGFSDWLGDRYAETGRPADALEEYRRVWSAAPFLGTYKKMRKAARAAGTWKEEKAGLIRGLEASGKQADRLIEICIFERKIAHAWRYFENPAGGGIGHITYLELAEASEKEFPEKAAIAYFQIANIEMSGKKRSAYQRACALLKKTHDISQRTGRLKEWEEGFAGFRERYAGLPAFEDELRKAGL